MVDDPLRDDFLAAPDAVQETMRDRRRPGRPENVSPHLIPLLRNAASAEIAPDDAPVADRAQDDRAQDDRAQDDLGPVRGIIAGLVLAVPLWSLIALAVWWVVG